MAVNAFVAASHKLSSMQFRFAGGKPPGLAGGTSAPHLAFSPVCIPQPEDLPI